MIGDHDAVRTGRTDDVASDRDPEAGRVDGADDGDGRDREHGRGDGAEAVALDGAAAVGGELRCQFAERAALALERALGGEKGRDADGDGREVEPVARNRRRVGDVGVEGAEAGTVGMEASVGAGMEGVGEVAAGTEDQERIGICVGAVRGEDCGHGGRLLIRRTTRQRRPFGPLRAELGEVFDWQASRTLEA
ncbi:MAG: hypothetical protein IT438_14745 [Phycisphaerales bacterium]|nr:hypothetical protein [Phycisphaerales bacterium]